VPQLVCLKPSQLSKLWGMERTATPPSSIPPHAGVTSTPDSPVSLVYSDIKQ